MQDLGAKFMIPYDLTKIRKKKKKKGEEGGF